MPVEFKESVECIEGHNAGMPVKVVFLPFVQGKTMQEKKSYCEKNLDHIRKMLTYEPRSGSNSYGVVVTKPADVSAHFGAIYFDPSGWHDMCGHETMFIGSMAVQRKMITASKFDTLSKQRFLQKYAETCHRGQYTYFSNHWKEEASFLCMKQWRRETRKSTILRRKVLLFYKDTADPCLLQEISWMN